MAVSAPREARADDGDIGVARCDAEMVTPAHLVAARARRPAAGRAAPGSCAHSRSRRSVRHSRDSSRTRRDPRGQRRRRGLGRERAAASNTRSRSFNAGGANGVRRPQGLQGAVAAARVGISDTTRRAALESRVDGSAQPHVLLGARHERRKHEQEHAQRRRRARRSAAAALAKSADRHPLVEAIQRRRMRRSRGPSRLRASARRAHPDARRVRQADRPCGIRPAPDAIRRSRDRTEPTCAAMAS